MLASVGDSSDLRSFVESNGSMYGDGLLLGHPTSGTFIPPPRPPLVEPWDSEVPGERFCASSESYLDEEMTAVPYPMLVRVREFDHWN
jgi:hypothetical protein